MKTINLILLSILMFLLMACSQEPAEIHYGSDECAYCKMMITDPQFASQIVTAKGKAITFDSIECLATYQKEHSGEQEKAKLWVPDYNDPGHWLNAVQAQYVKSEDIQSPMGESLLALPSAEAAEKHTTDKPGQLMKWKEAKQLKMEMNMTL